MADSVDSGATATPLPLRRKRVIVVAMVVATLTLIAAGASMRGLAVRADIRGDEFAVGDPVEFSFTVCSRSLVPRTTGNGDRIAWKIVHVETGETVASSAHYVWTADLEKIRWAPRQCRAAGGDRWDQREWKVGELDENHQLIRGEPVPPGQYRLEAKGDVEGSDSATFVVRQP